MIQIKNRTMVIPKMDRYIGTTQDNHAESRIFQIERYTSSTADISNLTFKLATKDEKGNANLIYLEKAIEEDHVILTWTVSENDVGTSGTMLAQIKAFDEIGTLRWNSFIGVFYVEKNLNMPDVSQEQLSDYEVMLQKVTKALEELDGAMIASVDMEDGNLIITFADETTESFYVKGEQGPGGTVTLGDVTYTESTEYPKISQRGTPENRIFDFELPLTGPKGNTGNGINSAEVEVKYQASNNGMAIPTGEWSASVPEVSDGMYLWTRVTIPYTDENSTIYYSIAKSGETGEQGAHYTPSISDDGELTWTNDGGLKNPDPVNIKGPKGDTGPHYTPSVSGEGMLTWENNGGLENPDPVNIKGPKGDPGSTEVDMDMVVTYATPEEYEDPASGNSLSTWLGRASRGFKNLFSLISDIAETLIGKISTTQVLSEEEWDTGTVSERGYLADAKDILDKLAQLNTDLGYVNIADKLSLPDGWINGGAYCEHGVVMICISIPAGDAVNGTFYISDERYIPRTTAAGVYAGFSTGNDAGKLVAARIQSSGIGSIWFSEGLVYSEPVVFCYPARY